MTSDARIIENNILAGPQDDCAEARETAKLLAAAFQRIQALEDRVKELGPKPSGRSPYDLSSRGLGAMTRKNVNRGY